MFIKFRSVIAPLVPHLVSKRALSSGSVRISEQKIKVGKIEINYVKSAVEGVKQDKTLVCLPGALGKKTNSHVIQKSF